VTVTQHQFRCGFCGAEYATAKPWARFCSPKCRVSANRARRAAESAEPPAEPAEPAPDIGGTYRQSPGVYQPEPWAHNDRQRALQLLQCHLGYASEARAALAVIEGLADPAATTLEAFVREAAPRRAIRPLLERR